MGCPQGSCSGPALWNRVASESLKDWPENTAIQAFADDFVIVSDASKKLKIENQINAAIEKFIQLEFRSTRSTKINFKFLQAKFNTSSSSN
ncbi:hypothetical protein AVEN_72508-1 [Araneus ventricosus]|uniref:Reverse transcriptase domain-containing protein n=1 Tax=Araneus ventricosus TaxID=182803 RepID=A0A4Y2G3Q2_ARAVE|nr:hypothetical protein AVEN_72508-1 [Araneus ventricosus]